MGSLVARNTIVEFILHDLEEGEIREVEESSTVHFQNTPNYFNDLEEGGTRGEKIEEEIMACVENASTYFDDLEEGEIREEIDHSFVAVLWNQEPMVTQDVTTAMELAPSKETIDGEKLFLEFRGKNHVQIRDKNAAKLLPFHKEIESSEADHIKDQTKDPKENSFTRQAKDPKENSLTRQVIEVCSKRSIELLSLQDLERKQFNLLMNELEREFKVNCSGKLSTQEFEILNNKFRKHMKAQDRKLIAMLIEARNREGKLKEQWLVKANEGTLEGSFYEIPLPCSGFKMDNFDCGAEMEVLAENGNCPSDDMHLDAVEDEGLSGSEILLEAQVELDHVIAEVSQCNDNALNATCVDPNVIRKSPSIGTPNSNFESEEMFEERNEMRCNATVQGVPVTREGNLNLNANSPPVIMPNSILQSNEGTLEEHGRACTNRISIGLAERNIQNPISNTNSPPGTVHTDQIVASDSTSHASTRPQEPQVNPAINFPYTSNMTTTSDLRLSTEGNVVAETPLGNQNGAPYEQSATQRLAPDVDIGTQLLQMVHHNVNKDPLQNELTTLSKLQKVLTERHNEKVARVRAEYERELDNTRRKYQRMEVEADAHLSDNRARLNMAYQKVCMQLRLAEEFQQMFYQPSVTGQLPIHGIVGQEQFPHSSQPRFTSYSPLRPATQLVAQQPSTSNYGSVPNPLTMPRVIQPRATFAPTASSWQRSALPVQSPQCFLNQPAVMNSYLRRAPIGGPSLMGFRPRVPPFNHMRPTPLSMPRVHMATTNFGNI